ncbi:MAG: hypothetical protein AAFX76_04685 [Planctomycetota bacterium]
MSVTDITLDQKELVKAVVVAAESGQYNKEFYYGKFNAASISGWASKKGQYEFIVEHASESDVRIAADEGYLFLHPKNGRIEWVAALQKAFDCFGNTREK